MTELQVKYWSYRETERTNRANEGLRRDELMETIRHNMSVEGETHRHNVATEAIGWAQVNETHRHNVAFEKETNRHNVATEGITNWYNHALINVRNREVGVREREADIKAFEANTHRFSSVVDAAYKKHESTLHTVDTAMNVLDTVSLSMQRAFQNVESVTRSAKNVNDIISTDDGTKVYTKRKKKKGNYNG